jgi:response regulator RpfG family c-di-GMP phosphodiesterase
VADFLDVDHVLQASAARWYQGAGASTSEKKVLLADRSPFARGLMRGTLEMSGYAVVEAGNLDEALRSLERNTIDAVLIAEDLPPNGASALVDAMRSQPEWGSIPVMDVAAWDKRRGAQAQGSAHDSNSTANYRGGVLDFLGGVSDHKEAELTGAVRGERG